MARRSVYEFEKIGVVSIWVATVPLSKIPKTYFEMREDDDEEAFTPFSNDFGFGWYDHDSVDSNNSSEKPKSLDRLIGECSFSVSFSDKAVAAAKKQGLDKTPAVFLLYDIDYRPKMTGVSQSKYMAFLGSFKHDPDAESVFLFAP
ncbi:MAG TPA: immunity 22 family protein [Gemmatimonadaceae bacterium]